MNKPINIFICIMCILSFLCSTLVLGAPANIEIVNEIFSYDNSDMQNYDEEAYRTYQPYDTLNTDDRSHFALSTVYLDYAKKYLDTELFVKARFEGFWGADNMGENTQNTALFFDNLYTNLYFLKRTRVGIGRQNYSIGNSLNDYFFETFVDGIVISHESEFYNFPYDVSALVDISGIASNPEDTSRFGHIQKDPVSIDDFGGDTLSLRLGLNASFYCARAFFYYLRFGASPEGGADISQNGQSPTNKADGDYLFMTGARLFHDFHSFGRGDVTYAMSDGYDFQFDDDRRYNGHAVVLNYETDIIQLFNFSEKYFRNLTTAISLADFSSDFSGMKGASFDDHLLHDYAGYVPAAYAGSYHIHDYAKTDGEETYEDKTVAKRFYRFNCNVLLQLGLEAGVGYMRLIANDRDEGTLTMGDYLTTSLGYRRNNITFNTKFSIFFPGEYYKVKHETNSFVPVGEDNLYGITSLFSTNFNLLN